MAKKYNQRNNEILEHFFYGNEIDKNIIDLTAGSPGKNLLKLCCEFSKIATEHRMKYELENNSFLFQYGPSLGMQDFLEALAIFLTDAYSDKVHISDLCVTSGATNGLHLILSTLINMTGIIFVDDVTYMEALETFSLFTEMKIVTIPMEENGVDIYEFRKLIKKHKVKSSKGKIFWGMYYTIPTFHNPTGILFSKENCKELLKLSREEDFLIVCDDVYNLLYYTEGNSPKRLFAYDNLEDEDYKGNIISNGSFSKIYAPGMRIGWIECPPRLIEIVLDCGILRSGGSVTNYTAGIFTSIMQLGFAKAQLKLYTDTYKVRMDTICNILEKNLPSPCFFRKPLGGYFVWISFPTNINCVEFNEFCKQNYQVVAFPGNTFSFAKKFNNYIRLTIGFHESDVLKKATVKFCDAVKDYFNKQTKLNN